MVNQNISAIENTLPDLGTELDLPVPVDVQSGTNYDNTIYCDYSSTSFDFISTQFGRDSFEVPRESDGSVDQARLLDSFEKDLKDCSSDISRDEVPIAGHVATHRQTQSEPGTKPVSDKPSSKGFQKRQKGRVSNLPPGEKQSMAGNMIVDPEMLLQPETRPISYEQLVIDVKGIYAGLVMVEANGIDIHKQQRGQLAAHISVLMKRPELTNYQWQSLNALHKQLLHENRDFFVASQHPLASTGLSKLAAKYSMPAHMWCHDIRAFLKVLRHRLPDSLKYMLAFIYIAYSMMALLYEIVLAFEDTWIECFGDLGRFRMAIEDDEPRDREVWSNVARFWYNKASDKTPDVGRLYHHLAILARPYTVEQLSLYTRSLTCLTSFESAKGSIMPFFSPVLHSKDPIERRESPLESLLIKAYAVLVASDPWAHGVRNLFDEYIRPRTAAYFKELGPFIAISNIAALFEYGQAARSKSRLRLACESLSTPSLALLIPPVSGNPLEKTNLDHGADNLPSPQPYSAFVGGPYLIFAIGVLLTAHLLANKKGRIPVWGCMTAVWAFAWWGIRDDDNTTLWLSATVFVMWLVATFLYGSAAFQKYGISHSLSLLVLLIGSILDFSLVGVMTPTGAPIAQSDLLSLWLPSTSLSLTTIVNVIAYIRHPLERKDHEESGISSSGNTANGIASYPYETPYSVSYHTRGPAAELPVD